MAPITFNNVAYSGPNSFSKACRILLATAGLLFEVEIAMTKSPWETTAGSKKVQALGRSVGVPLVAEQGEPDDGQIEDIWFSDIQEIPGHIKLVELLGLIQAQLCRCNTVIQ